MLSPHELRTVNNLSVLIRLIDRVRDQLHKRGQRIKVGATIDSAHLLYPRKKNRPKMDVAFGGNAIPEKELLAEFGQAVKGGYVHALHVSVDYSRSHPLKPGIDGQELPIEDFMTTALENGFEGCVDIEVMNGSANIILDSGLEGLPNPPNWEENDPAEPIVSTLKFIERFVS